MGHRQSATFDLNFREIDDRARNGEFWSVRKDQQLAVARWRQGWQFASGQPLLFEPDEYLPDLR